MQWSRKFNRKADVYCAALTAILTFGRVSAIDTERVINRTKEQAFPSEYFWTELKCFFINFFLWFSTHLHLICWNCINFKAFYFKCFYFYRSTYLHRLNTQTMYIDHHQKNSSVSLKERIKKNLAKKVILFK